MRLIGVFLLTLVLLGGTLEPLRAQPYNVEAGPIWNNMDAQTKCPGVCGGLGARWNGQWHTTVQGQMSVCSCEKHRRRGHEFQAGPIWNDADAQGKCPAVCGGQGRSWTGQWHTTEPGRMSVCACR